jgi:hypothetical protein
MSVRGAVNESDGDVDKRDGLTAGLALLYGGLNIIAVLLIALTFFVDIRAYPASPGYPPPVDADAVSLNVALLAVAVTLSLVSMSLRRFSSSFRSAALMVALVSLTRLVTIAPLLPG